MILKILGAALSKMLLKQVSSVMKKQGICISRLKMLNSITMLSIEEVVKLFQLPEELCMLAKSLLKQDFWNQYSR